MVSSGAAVSAAETRPPPKLRPKSLGDPWRTVSSQLVIPLAGIPAENRIVMLIYFDCALSELNNRR